MPFIKFSRRRLAALVGVSPAWQLAGGATVKKPKTPGNSASPAANALDARHYGADPSGTLDSTAALRDWLTALGNSAPNAFGFLPAGIFKTTANLVIPADVNIFGAGYRLSIIKPQRAVKVAVTTSDNATLKGIMIDGTATTNAVGLSVAPTITNSNNFEEVWIQNFSGASAVGLLVANSVGMSAKRVIISRCGTNCKIASSNPGLLPTTVNFEACRFYLSSVGPGVLINSGQSLVFTNNCIFEANKQQGILAQSVTRGVIQNLLVEKAWFEDNYFDHIDNGTRVYSFQMDGTAGAITSANLSDTHFTQGAVLSDRKAVLVNNATCSFSRLQSLLFPFDFTIEGAASYIQVIDDTADRCARAISNATGANVVYPVYRPIWNNGDGTSALPIDDHIVNVPYGSSITFDAYAADSFAINVSNTTAFTINAPLRPTAGRKITVKVQNVSGNNTLGAVTWNAVFKMAAWVSPQNSLEASITFLYDGTNWRETGRGSVNIPV